MDVRSQVSMLFHLDKCIGCHTCSIACKNIWTDRKGAEYMWWNNVETKPGTGYPTKWEDQDIYKGGWAGQGLLINPDKDIVAVYLGYAKDDEFSSLSVLPRLRKVLNRLYP